MGADVDFEHEAGGPLPKEEGANLGPNDDAEGREPEVVSTRRGRRKKGPVAGVELGVARAIRKRKEPGTGVERMGDEAEPSQVKRPRKR